MHMLCAGGMQKKVGEERNMRLYKMTMQHSRRKAACLYTEPEYEKLTVEAHIHSKNPDADDLPGGRKPFFCIYCKQQCKDKNRLSWHRMTGECKAYDGSAFLKMYPTWTRSTAEGLKIVLRNQGYDVHEKEPPKRRRKAGDTGGVPKKAKLTIRKPSPGARSSKEPLKPPPGGSSKDTVKPRAGGSVKDTVKTPSLGVAKDSVKETPRGSSKSSKAAQFSEVDLRELMRKGKSDLSPPSKQSAMQTRSGSQARMLQESEVDNDRHLSPDEDIELMAGQSRTPLRTVPTLAELQKTTGQNKNSGAEQNTMTKTLTAGKAPLSREEVEAEAKSEAAKFTLEKEGGLRAKPEEYKWTGVALLIHESGLVLDPTLLNDPDAATAELRNMHDRGVLVKKLYEVLGMWLYRDDSDEEEVRTFFCF